MQDHFLPTAPYTTPLLLRKSEQNRIEGSPLCFWPFPTWLKLRRMSSADRPGADVSGEARAITAQSPRGHRRVCDRDHPRAKTGFPRSTKPAADFCQVEFQSRLQSLTSHRPFANISAGCLPTSYQRKLGRFERVALRMGG